MSEITAKDVDLIIAANMVVQAVERLGVGTMDQFLSYQRDIAELKARCARLTDVAVAAETLVGIEWPLHKDGIVDMGETHPIHQLQIWLDELQDGDLSDE